MLKLNKRLLQVLRLKSSISFFLRKIKSCLLFYRHFIYNKKNFRSKDRMLTVNELMAIRVKIKIYYSY